MCIYIYIKLPRYVSPYRGEQFGVWKDEEFGPISQHNKKLFGTPQKVHGVHLESRNYYHHHLSNMNILTIPSPTWCVYIYIYTSIYVYVSIHVYKYTYSIHIFISYLERPPLQQTVYPPFKRCSPPGYVWSQDERNRLQDQAIGVQAPRPAINHQQFYQDTSTPQKNEFPRGII